MDNNKSKQDDGFYKKCVKRILDILSSAFAIIILFPLLIILSFAGAIAMKGNPFFTQLRTGKKQKNGIEKEFKLIKFRTMSNAKDAEGNLLPDEVRLNRYGRVLRMTSLDELPELFNICKGDMSIVGPRPLVPEYIKYYTTEERKRHDVRPGLTGLAQVNGRSYLSWDEIFKYDIEYTNNVTFLQDLKIILMTAKKVFARENIADASEFKTDEEGRLYVTIDGHRRYIHKELNVERQVLGKNKSASLHEV